MTGWRARSGVGGVSRRVDRECRSKFSCAGAHDPPHCCQCLTLLRSAHGRRHYLPIALRSTVSLLIDKGVLKYQVNARSTV
uniref:Uncharacterized protein n=1 Tax=Ralstonia solanacearum TaxID=305 RepID=A0A0S4W6Q4_RALSL|nr:protein of unknown function [Ralstonia solanacearum]CUV37135.1 protein of unknown function [Ralstonia solanacearum]CUV42484.1 protein of unknown function [Ralstonia solanacearum]CUV61304.1 protein of unknown function [Ralstonia solanacearum]